VTGVGSAVTEGSLAAVSSANRLPGKSRVVVVVDSKSGYQVLVSCSREANLRKRIAYTLLSMSHFHPPPLPQPSLRFKARLNMIRLHQGRPPA